MTSAKARDVAAIKDDERERPIPSAWRPALRDIVQAFARHDYQLTAGVVNVAPVSAETAQQIRDSIAGYDETLAELPEEAWNSSTCIWMGDRWDALIDLWTVSEGRSDLVLHARVHESGGGHLIHVYMVYVP